MERINQEEPTPEKTAENDSGALEMLSAGILKELTALGFERNGIGGEFVRRPKDGMPQIRLSIKKFKKYYMPSSQKHQQIWNGSISQEYELSSEPAQAIFYSYHAGEIFESHELTKNVCEYLIKRECRAKIGETAGTC